VSPIGAMKPFYVHITDPSFRDDSGYFYQVRGWPPASLRPVKFSTVACAKMRFGKAWEQALDDCKARFDDWNVTDVIKLMRHRKWLMKACDFVRAHY
jgi:hypothetical protein